MTTIMYVRSKVNHQPGEFNLMFGYSYYRSLRTAAKNRPLAGERHAIPGELNQAGKVSVSFLKACHSKQISTPQTL